MAVNTNAMAVNTNKKSDKELDKESKVLYTGYIKRPLLSILL